METWRYIHRNYPRAVKLKGLLSTLETAREAYVYSGLKSKHEMNLRMAYRNRYRGTKFYGGRRLAAVVTPSRSPIRKRARVVLIRKRRSARGRGRFSKKAIGEPVGTSNTKNFDNTVEGSIGTRQPYNMTLVAVAKGTQISQRERDIINCRGFQIFFDIRNEGLTANDVLYVNCAVVAPKDSIAINPVNFFRALSDLDSRSYDFNLGRTSIELHRLPLNTDTFTILKHKRFSLTQKGAGIAGFQKTFKWWIPLRRQLTYGDANADSCITPIFFVYWCDKAFNSSGAPAVPNVAVVQIKVTTFFRDTKN